MPPSQMHSSTPATRLGNGAAGFRISSGSEIPQDKLVQAVNDALAQAPFATQIKPIGHEPLEGAGIQRSFPGLDVMWQQTSPIHVTRMGPVLAHGTDSLLFGWVMGERTATYFGEEYLVPPGEGLAVGNAGRGSSTYPSPSKQITIIVPQRTIKPFLRDKSTHFVHRVPPNSGAMKLLVGYLEVLNDAVVPPELESSIVAHVHDLLTVTLGATCDGTELARTRGVRAARLHAIKRDVLKAMRSDVSIEAIATQNRLTPRYVQMLFEQEGTTFTAFLREQRLSRARAMLASTRFDHKRIGEIAFEVGFNDLSYFTRAFRQRFGMTPGEARQR